MAAQAVQSTADIVPGPPPSSSVSSDQHIQLTPPSEKVVEKSETKKKKLRKKGKDPDPSTANRGVDTNKNNDNSVLRKDKKKKVKGKVKGKSKKKVDSEEVASIDNSKKKKKKKRKTKGEFKSTTTGDLNVIYDEENQAAGESVKKEKKKKKNKPEQKQFHTVCKLDSYCIFHNQLITVRVVSDENFHQAPPPILQSCWALWDKGFQQADTVIPFSTSLLIFFRRRKTEVLYQLASSTN